jgi:methionyl-tRNA synthetase
MRVVGEANKYLSDQAPWKLKEDPARRDTVLFTALQAVSDCNALLTPFLPHSAQKVHELLGGSGVWSAAPQVQEVTDLDDGSPYPIITGDYGDAQSVWESRPLPPGTPLAPPTPVFKKLDESVVEEELARLEEEADKGEGAA